MGKVLIKKFVIFVSLFFLLIVPMSFAAENETIMSDDADSVVVMLDNADVLKDSNDYYFNASAESDGDGSISNPYKYLTADRIKSNCNIYLADGEYHLDNSKSIDKVNIYGSNVDKTVIQYNGMGFTVNSYLTIQNVTFSGMSITNNGNIVANNTVFSHGSGSRYDSYGNNFGGAIYSQSSSNAHVTLNNCTFEHNYAIYGGAIYMANGYLEIVDTIFNFNMAYNYGGAIACENTINVTISKSKFYNSISKNDAGGAIYVRSSPFTGNSIDFVNSSSTFGSAITSLKSTVSLVDVYCENNTARWDGGAIYHMYGDFSLTDSKFLNNSARNGGALFIDNSTSLFLRNNVFVNNLASHTAGSIYSILNIFKGPIDQQNNTFNGNQAYFMNDIFDTSTVNLTIGNGNYTMYKVNPVEVDDLPSSYSLYDEGYTTIAKDQETGGNCWAFAVLSVVESCILKAGGTSMDLSEENMKNLMALYSDYGWNINVNEGGYAPMPFAYLTSWLGPILESDDLTDDKSALSPILNSILHIQNIMFLKRDNFTDNDAIKRALIQYGAVGTTMAFYNSYITSNNYYCYDSMGCNHAVAIVGWDDDYSKLNFRRGSTIEGDGAWIVKNSWGSNWGDNGYFYVSYYDMNFARPGVNDASYTVIFNDTIRYDKNYQYDIPGASDYFLNSSNSLWYKNIFKATDDEYLAAISTYFDKVTNWTVHVYVNDELKVIKDGKSNPGYYTIDLNCLIPLKIGDIFEVVFNIKVDGEASFPISEKISFNKLMYGPGISYLSYDGEIWKDLYELSWQYSSHTYYSQVACIKAFTVLNEIKTDLKLTVEFNNENPANITAKIWDQYGNPLKSGEVKFHVNEDDYVVNVVNGIAILHYPFSNVLNNIYAVFEGDGYISSENYTLFAIEKYKLGIDFDITRNLNNVVIDIIANDKINNEAKLFVNEQEYLINFVEGKDSLNLTNLENGVYNLILNISFSQDSIYENNTVYDSFIIDMKNSKILANDLIITDEDDINYVVFLFDENDNPISNKTIELLLDDKFYNLTTDDNGQVVFSMKLDLGSYAADINFRGDNDYFNSSATSNIKVRSQVLIDWGIEKYLNNVTLSINLSKQINDTLTVIINNKTEKIEVKNGIASLSLINLENDIYNVNISLNDTLYEFDEISTSFVVDVKQTQIIANDVEISDVSQNYTVVLLDEFNNALSNKSIELILDGKTYNTYTDINGQATFLIQLSSGSYVSYINFEGDNEYLNTNSSSNFKVKSKLDVNLTTQISTNNVLVTVMLSKNITDFLTLNINNNTTTVQVVNGVVKYNLSNLENGEYKLSVSLDDDVYIYNDVLSTIVIDVVHTRVLANDLIINDETPINYTILLVDMDGNPILNKSVEINLNETYYNQITDDNGQIIIPLDLNYGVYCLNITFRGDDKYINSNNSTTIKVKTKLNIQSGIDKFANNVTLAFNLSKSINDALTVVLNNDSYVIDVVDGVGFLTLFDLENGVYNISVSLNEDDYDFNAVQSQFVIDMKQINILCDDIIINDEENFIYNITLIDENNQVIANKEIEIILNGNIFNKTTDINGQILIPINLAQGIYTLKINSACDDSYFKNNKSIIITVKSKVIIDLNIDKFANNVTLAFNLSKSIDDALTVVLNGVSYDVGVVDGVGFLSLFDLDNGVYEVSAGLDEGIYDFDAVTGQFVVDVRKTAILVDDLYVNDEVLVNYTISLIDYDGNSLINKSIRVNLNGSIYDVFTDVNGKAVILISLESGNYYVIAEFSGDDSYFESANASVVNVKSKVSIDLSVDKFANNVILAFNLSKSIDDTLTVVLNGVSYDVGVVDGVGFLSLFDLDNGVYEVSAGLDDVIYDFDTLTGQFVVDVRKTTILVDDLYVNDEDLVNYSIYLIDENGIALLNKSVELTIASAYYNLTTDVNGKVVIPISLESGNYDVIAEFRGDDSYFGSSNSSVVNVRNKVIIDLNIDKFANNVNMTINLSKSINDTLTVVINNKTYEMTVNDGHASLNLFNLENSIYDVGISLNDNIYDFNQINDQFIIDFKQSKIMANDLTIMEYEFAVFNLTLVDENFNPIINRSIEFSLNGTNYAQITDMNGQISISFNLSKGYYEIKSQFGGDNYYSKSSSTNKIAVEAIQIIPESFDNFIDDAIIKLNSSYPNETFIVKINEKTYHVNVNNYTEDLPLNNLSNGGYNITISLNNSYFKNITYQYVINTKNSTIISEDLIAYHNCRTTYSIKLFDLEGNALADKLVSFDLNGVKTNVLTNEYGQAFVDLNLPVGVYEINITYSGESYSYYSSSTSNKIIVKSTIVENDSTTKTYNSQYAIRFLDNEGKALRNSDITYILDNATYIKSTDMEGYLFVNILQKPGNHTLTFINPVNDEILSKNISVVARITQNNNLVMFEYGGKIYKVLVLDDNGNPVKSNEIVQMNINGKTYNVKTNYDGFASLKINLKNKKYTITATYNGYVVSNKITVKPVLITKDISVKNGKKIVFKAKLLNNNGKILKSKKVTFKFKGKKYTIKTDKKGFAKLTLKMKLKSGPYKIYTLYGKSKATNKIVIKK